MKVNQKTSQLRGQKNPETIKFLNSFTFFIDVAHCKKKECNQ